MLYWQSLSGLTLEICTLRAKRISLQSIILWKYTSKSFKLIIWFCRKGIVCIFIDREVVALTLSRKDKKKTILSIHISNPNKPSMNITYGRPIGRNQVIGLSPITCLKFCLWSWYQLYCIFLVCSTLTCSPSPMDWNVDYAWYQHVHSCYVPSWSWLSRMSQWWFDSWRFAVCGILWMVIGISRRCQKWRAVVANWNQDQIYSTSSSSSEFRPHAWIQVTERSLPLVHSPCRW